MATNTQTIEQRICRCKNPQKEYYTKACKNCWKCGECKTYGGCDKLGEWMNWLFTNNHLIEAPKRELAEQMEGLRFD